MVVNWLIGLFSFGKRHIFSLKFSDKPNREIETTSMVFPLPGETVDQVTNIYLFNIIFDRVFFMFKPLSAGFFFVIRGQSVTQESIGREASRYPPWCQGL